MDGLLTWEDNYCRKLVIIGDGACGKTSLLSVFTLGYFPTVSVLKTIQPIRIRSKQWLTCGEIAALC